MADDLQLDQSLQKAQAGDREAFAHLYDQIAPRLYKFIYFRVGHKEIAEDILSDTFVKAWLKIAQIHSSKALLGWIYQIAKNNIIDYYRVRKTVVALEDVVEIVLEDAINPVDALDLAIEEQKIIKLIERLSKEQQQVIKYKFFEDLTNEEIAFLMNKTEGAIRVLQHRAIIRLKTLLNKKHEKD